MCDDKQPVFEEFFIQNILNWFLPEHFVSPYRISTAYLASLLQIQYHPIWRYIE